MEKGQKSWVPPSLLHCSTGAPTLLWEALSARRRAEGVSAAWGSPLGHPTPASLPSGCSITVLWLNKKFQKVSLPLHSRLQVHKELWKGWLIDGKNTFKTTYWLMMQKMLWISIPFLIYYFNYLTFYRPLLVGFFWFRFQFSVSWWKLFIIIISKIQNLLAVFIKFIYYVQPLENDKEGTLARVLKCFMQNYLSIRMIKSSSEYL